MKADPQAPGEPAALPRVRTIVEIPIDRVAATGSFISFEGLCVPGEHLAIAFGGWRAAPVPVVRIHSECLTGDVFGSMRCDCQAQLHEAIDTVHAAGGLILYLRQEGRGIGLYNKLDAYRLQLSGLDTYEANRALGFGEDLRSYAVAAEMLRALGIGRIRLLTNNPDKLRQLERENIAVEDVVATGIFENPHNRAYLKAKLRDRHCSPSLASFDPEACR